MTDISDARERIIIAISAALTTADNSDAPPEAKKSLAQAYNAFAQWLESIADGKSYISKTGHFDFLYNDIENTNRGGLVVKDEKGKHKVIKPSKKWIKKLTARTLKDLKEEALVSPEIQQIEIFFAKYIQPGRAQKQQDKKKELSESAFGTKKGGERPTEEGKELTYTDPYWPPKQGA